MKRIFLLPLLSLLMLASISSVAQKKIIWSTITDYDHNCSIKLPGAGKSTFKNTSEGTKYTTYELYGQSSYFLKVLDMKTEAKDKKARASKTAHDLASKFHGKITEEVDWLIGTRTGVQVQFEIIKEGEPDLQVFHHVVVVGKVQYEVLMMTPKELYDPAFDDNFLNSFQFLK